MLGKEIRYAGRSLLQRPGFSLVAVLTLALGIGANTAIFSLVNTVLLRALPYEEADRLVFLTEWSQQVPEMSFSVANLKDVRDQSTSFESLVGYNGTGFILNTEGAEAERLSGRQVADRIQRLRPGVRVLFMSGYAQGDEEAAGLHLARIGEQRAQ